ncbi:MAG: PulJ/GspJ family protein [Candidatus Acidiferrales bacterium]
MKKPGSVVQPPSGQDRIRSRGFTLIELMVAMLVFLIVAGTAFSVFDKHMEMITHQEALSGVNLALRNATSQLQIDLSGAGQNLLSGAGQNLATKLGDFSTGVVIQNSVPPSQGGTAAACVPAGNWTYPASSGCFDSLTIFGPQNVGCTATTNGQPPVLAIADSELIDSNSTISATDPADSTGAILATDKNCFQSGDELLLIQMPSPGGSNPTCDAAAAQFTYCISAVTLTAAPSVNTVSIDGSNVTVLQLTHTLTGSNGVPSGCPGSSCTDPQGVLYNPQSPIGYNFQNAVSRTFSPGAFVVDIGSSSSQIKYSVVVSPSNTADTQLQRCDSSGCAVLADQVIGFKLGAALWSNESNDQPDIANYFYDSSKYCYDSDGTTDCNATPAPANDPYDFGLIRAVRVSLIGRTIPSTDPVLNKFANGFDNGPYLVQQSSVVVDLRNMSIGDFQN